MTGTIISLSEEWIKSYAERVGVPEGTVIRAITDFNADVESYTSIVQKEGLDKIAILCNDEGFPRIDDYLPKKIVESKAKTYDKSKLREKTEEEAIRKREAMREAHRKLREKRGMPQIGE